MRILVTGGLGIIGSGLVRELRARGHEAISLDLRHQPDQHAWSIHEPGSPGTYVRCDVGEFRQLQRVMEQLGPFDYVYHCAAEFGRWNGEDHYEALWRTNVIGTKHIIRLQERERFRLIHFSSSEVYGDWLGVMAESVMDEYEVKQLNDYAMTKWVNEGQIRNSAEQFGTESVIVRLFNTYGPGEYYSPYRSVNVRFLYSALTGRPWTVFRGHSRTSTYLDDTVRTVANICERFMPGEVYNIGGKALHSIEELSDLVLEVTGADAGLVRYAESERLTTTHKVVDTSKADAQLGHQNTVSLKDGLTRTAEWLCDVYKLMLPVVR